MHSKWLKSLRRKIKRLCEISFICIGSFLLIQAACPNPSVTDGYMGNVGTTAGNCSTYPLPPLCAFGSVSINQNSPLQSVNRLNPTQLPTTNNFQLFQNPCGVNLNQWVSGGTNGVSAGAGGLRMRAGPFLVGMAQTGPIATVAQFNFNQNKDLPAITADSRMTFFFSATETNQSGNDYFNVSTNIVNSETCEITYTPKNGTNGTITDYIVTGNVFHDVYYNNLHPAIAISNTAVVSGGGILMSVDGGPLQSYAFESHVTGKIFQFFVQRYSGVGPATFILYVVDANDSPLTFKVCDNTGTNFPLTLDHTQPAYTGFLRLAAISTNDPLASPGTQWQQSNYYMPEDIANSADTSNPPSSCAIEVSGCPLTPTTPNWWTTPQVDTISPTGMTFYMLLPTGWAALFQSLATKVINGNWIAPSGTSIQYPASQAMSIFLPAIAMNNYNTAFGWYQDLVSQLNPSCTLPNPPNCASPPAITDGSDFSTNYFTLLFDMIMASNLASDISTFQTGNRTLPTYIITAPVNNVAVYTAHRRYVPTRADISTTANSVSWTYTLSSAVPPGDGQNKALVCFPFWKYLQGTTPGVVNTTPGGGQPLQNFIFNDTVKGTLYTAEAINGVVTFLEGGTPSWFTPTDLFIPSTLGATFTGTQVTQLGQALTMIENEVIPLPYFPENRLDPAYDAGKTCFMLAKTALYIAYYMSNNGSGSTPAQIKAKTQPYIDNSKSILNAYLISRTPGSSYFVADRTSGGICVNGAGGNGAWAKGPNLQQSVDSGVDFGNYVYNDHHFFAGYYLLASAMVTSWELTYNPGSLWINLPVVGADNQTYKVRDMIDFLWRDTHNPFTNDNTQAIYDPDLPYDRYSISWEGHSIANGLQYEPSALGRNQESIAEDFNCFLGMNAFAQVVLQTALSGPETMRYQTVRDFSLMRLKMAASSGILWYKNYTFWKGANQFTISPSPTTPAIYIGQFTQATVTNGQVNDNSAQNQTFF
ncbi:MAG: glycosyl hydrolase [Parachlamydiales bacterium]